MSETESKIMIQEYSKNPVNNFKMGSPDITQHEGNFICGDDITVYLKIKDKKVSEFSFDWNCSTITTAWASLLAEIITDQDIEKIAKRNYKTLQEKGFEVSRRRKNAAIIALLATINGIYKYEWKEKTIDFDDLTE